MTRPKILIQLDTDAHASVFDAVTAIDAGVDHLLQYQNVQPHEVAALVNGAMFTRGPKHLHNTAVFIGGSSVQAGEAVLKKATGAFFGPLHVSVMLDANGANTTAAAAVLCAGRHLALKGATATVLAATGPVGQRVVRLLARQGASVRVASRSAERAQAVCDTVAESIEGASLTAVATSSPEETQAALEGATLLVSAGALGIELVSAPQLAGAASLQAAIDLNAAPPYGIAGIEAHDAATQRGSLTAYGALGVGGLKMKIHKAAIAKMFTQNDLVLDAAEIYDLGADL